MKYVICESCARQVRDFARGYLDPDPHADPTKGFEYAVHSLYLDSPSLTLCRATMMGHKNRFKLRIRFYDDSPDSPAFLEVKRRVNDAVRKQRVAVRKSCIQRVLAGHWPGRPDVIDYGLRSHLAIQAFCNLRTMIQAQGQVVVSYMREAYVSPHSNHVRVTFDRRLHGVAYGGDGTLRRDGVRAVPKMDGVILEVKFTNRFPEWLSQMAQCTNIVRCSCAKYVKCMAALRAPQMQLH